MKIAVVLNTSEPETVWNAIRLGIEAGSRKHEVTVFLMNRGVESQNLPAKPPYDVPALFAEFKKQGGTVLACGTCLKTRGLTAAICPASTMTNLVRLIEESDRTLTFG